MRITSIETKGIGGLSDGRLEFPDLSVIALAGGNGTGKSKLLACILSLWTNALPPAQADLAEVVLGIRITDSERIAFESAGRVIWGDVAALDDLQDFTVTISQQPLAGVSRQSDPARTALAHAWTQPGFIQSNASLDVVYLPAERRLIDSGTNAIDLRKLNEDEAFATTAAARGAVQQYGRLDDQEFENYARALCVAATLPNDPESSEAERESDAGARWAAFHETVNGLIAPKTLLSLTRQNPDQLLIMTSSGAKHSVSDLSSGERQALIIISRVLRAGAERTLVLIDEPDAYLHPHLSRRLFQALEQGVSASGQLIVATHSPAILDTLAAESIVRHSHDHAPRILLDEADRLDLYRQAGFRASAVTQSDVLVAVEGIGDSVLLQHLMPELARASIYESGGRARVMEAVQSLNGLALPVVGLVDGDVDAPAVAPGITDLVSVLPVADLEAAFLADDAALEVMVERGFAREGFTSVLALRAVLDELVECGREAAIAEMAQRAMRQSHKWPSPRVDNPLGELRAAVGRFVAPTTQELEIQIVAATARWDAFEPQERWTVVRGKYILGRFTSVASCIRDGRQLLEAIARAKPGLSALMEFEQKVGAAIG